jgi:REP element-mobilizing transposase RayT
MNRGLARSLVFHADCDRVAFLDELGNAADEFAVAVHAYCLMGNHYHLLVQSLEGRLSLAMQRLSSRFTHRMNLQMARVGPLFRGRFHSIGIADDGHLIQALRYIHCNPVASGAVHRPEDRKWSSAGCYLGLEPPPHWLRTGDLLAMFGADSLRGYREFIGAGVDTGTKELYAAAFPMGSDPWV